MVWCSRGLGCSPFFRRGASGCDGWFRERRTRASVARRLRHAHDGPRRRFVHPFSGRSVAFRDRAGSHYVGFEDMRVGRSNSCASVSVGRGGACPKGGQCVMATDFMLCGLTSADVDESRRGCVSIVGPCVEGRAVRRAGTTRRRPVPLVPGPGETRYSRCGMLARKAQGGHPHGS